MRNIPVILCIISVLLVSTSSAQEASVTDSQTTSLFNWLYTGNDSAAHITIETDVRGLIRQKLKEEYQKASITLRNTKGEEQSHEFKLRARGNRRKEVCFYPPIKLKFKKSMLTDNGMDPSFDDVKLVVQCRETTTSRYYVYKEYMAYKMYNMISPYSFRVQLVNVIFNDNSGKGKTREMKGFIIEPEEEMALRLEGKLVERKPMRSSFLELDPYQKMGVFQYMIGNTDWAIGNSHNLKFIKVPAYGRLVPIPYDFDYSGLVNTDYAIPFHTLPIERVTQRLYRGAECAEQELPPLMEYFKSKENAVMKYIDVFPYLNEAYRRETARYLGEFFEMLDDFRWTKRELGTN